MRLWPYMSMMSSNYKGVQSHSTFHMFSFLHLTTSISQHKQDQILFPEHVGMLKEGGKERRWGRDPWDGSIHPDTLSWYPCLSKSHLPSPASPPPPKSQRWIFPFWTTAIVSTGALHSLFVVLNWRQFGPSGTSGKDWQSLDTFLVFIIYGWGATAPSEEVRYAAEHLTIYRTRPQRKELSSPTCQQCQSLETLLLVPLQ